MTTLTAPLTISDEQRSRYREMSARLVCEDRPADVMPFVKKFSGGDLPIDIIKAETTFPDGTVVRTQETTAPGLFILSTFEDRNTDAALLFLDAVQYGLPTTIVHERKPDSSHGFMAMWITKEGPMARMLAQFILQDHAQRGYVPTPILFDQVATRAEDALRFQFPEDYPRADA